MNTLFVILLIVYGLVCFVLGRFSSIPKVIGSLTLHPDKQILDIEIDTKNIDRFKVVSLEIKRD